MFLDLCGRSGAEISPDSTVKQTLFKGLVKLSRESENFTAVCILIHLFLERTENFFFKIFFKEKSKYKLLTRPVNPSVTLSSGSN